MIAGLVEYLASHKQLSAPEWVYDEDRFLTVFWFPVDLSSIRVSAFRDAPRRWPDVVCSSTAGTCNVSLNITDAGTALRLFEQVFPGQDLADRQRLVIEDILDR